MPELLYSGRLLGSLMGCFPCQASAWLGVQFPSDDRARLESTSTSMESRRSRTEVWHRSARRTLLSFERPAHRAGFSRRRPAGRAHLENSIVETHRVLLIKRTRAHGGCLGAESR